MNLKMKILLSVVIASPFNLIAEESVVKKEKEIIIAKLSETKDEVRFHTLIDRSIEAYSSIVKGKHGEVPQSVLKNARCIAIMPNVITGAILVGGSHGEGLASCKSASGKWSQPAPVMLNQGSLGIQAGAKSADLVLFFQNDKAVNELKMGSFAMGADVSAVAGTYDSNVDKSSAGVLVYTRAEGLFAGASINGGKIGKDENEVAKFYGKNIDYTSLLESKISPDTSGYTSALTNLLPQ
jgi:lipid-binding SYLF domain-containing protein